MMSYREKFNSLPWHDSVLLNLEVNRKDPGESDTVRMSMRWPNGVESSVTFEGCYFFEAKFNFGIIAEESILSAECVDEGDQLSEIRSKWSSLGVELDKLLCYKINTNSTNSTLKVFSLSVLVKAKPDTA